MLSGGALPGARITQTEKAQLDFGGPDSRTNPFVLRIAERPGNAAPFDIGRRRIEAELNCRQMPDP